MNSNFNKKKINFFPNRWFLKYFIITIFFVLLFVFAYLEFNNRDRFTNIIQNISEKFNYQFLHLELNSLNRVDKSEVLKIINKYYNQSIFLIPLNDISNSLHDLNWVKSVNLSSNFLATGLPIIATPTNLPLYSAPMLNLWPVHFLLCLWYLVTNSLASFKDKGITFNTVSFGGIKNNASSPTGDIDFTTSGHTNLDHYTVVLEMRKQY